MPEMVALVRGVGDIGSAVAHRLFQDGCAVVIHDEPRPATSRRGMAFTDAVFDGRAVLDGVPAVRVDDLETTQRMLDSHDEIPVYVRPLEPLIAAVQRGLAPLTIGLGPGFVAGHHADVVIETSWEDLGRVILAGASLPLSGEPREIDGHGRDRYVYAPVDGVFRTSSQIGDAVGKGQPIAFVDSVVLLAPLGGVLRGLTRDGVPVSARTKVIEVDPRGERAGARGIVERPRRIAEATLAAIRAWGQDGGASVATPGPGPRA
jgi:xanthine dehydrogenase accessory factor